MIESLGEPQITSVSLLNNISPKSIPPSVNAMTPFTAYGNDCLYMALGDGDGKQFTDIVAASVDPQQTEHCPPPVLLCFVRKVD